MEYRVSFEVINKVEGVSSNYVDTNAKMMACPNVDDGKKQQDSGTLLKNFFEVMLS